MRARRWFRLLAVGVAAASLGLAGCSGSDGKDGAQGPQGPEGPAGPAGPPGAPATELVDASTATGSASLAGVDIVSEITGVTIASPPVVDFKVTTADGVNVTGIGALWEDSNRFVRFTIAKLVPGTASNAPDNWVSYTREVTDDGNTPPDYDTGSSLVDHGDGTYTFTFNTDVNNVEGVTYEPDLIHRVAGQIGSGDVTLEPQNLVYDFVPATGEPMAGKQVAVMSSCNECHGNLVFHGRRFVIDYCDNCHNPDLEEGEGNLSFMIHKIHSGGTFTLWTDRNGDPLDFSEVTYPQDLTNCRKCHNEVNPDTPDGGNWATKQTGSLCFDSCHAVPDSVPAFHTVESNCSLSGCHGETGIPLDNAVFHVTDNATRNNPQVPVGAVNFTYEISEATVDAGNVAAIKFRILADGTPVEFGTAELLAGFTGSPSFLFAYALPQQGFDEPADFNNLGQSAGQPPSVSISNIWNGTSGTLSAPDVDGYYTATVADAFPVGATMRTVALQGYFTQVDPAVSRHTPSAVMTVTGDAARREVVDGNKCEGCHEWFEGHGGNRVIGDGNGATICLTCHVPNLSSSGRTFDIAAFLADPTAFNQSSADTVAARGEDPLLWPEDTNNFKDLIHGIHAATNRPYEFVRIRGGNAYNFDWSEVTFPGILSNCETCHLPGTYEPNRIPASALVTTTRTTYFPDGSPAETRADILAARDTVPNDTDLVNTVIASTCFYCHDSSQAVNHITLNGGVISAPPYEDPAFFGSKDRFEVVNLWPVSESCLTCHGAGKSADVSTVHGVQ